MGRRSSIERDPAIRDAVDQAIKRGATIDQIVHQLRGAGVEIGRSAVGRYTKTYAALAARQRDLQAVAKAFGSEFGGPDDTQGRLMIQMATNLITRTVMDLDAEEDPDISSKILADLGRAVKDVTSAAKIDVEREAKIRDEAARKAKAEAADAADEEGRAAGASEETLSRIRRKILGLR